MRRGAGHVEIPNALNKKLPNASREWPWQWVFPATRRYRDRETNQRRRHHLHETVVQRAIRAAAQGAGITKRTTCHTLRHNAASRIMPTTFSLTSLFRTLRADLEFQNAA